jgi:DNA-binding XRE family transcriptional regulator/predicted RNase H-like HicB family nuclease
MPVEPTVDYSAVVTKEGKFTLAEFPDCPGCQTFVEGGESIETMAADALNGWLISNLGRGISPPRPGSVPIAKGAKVISVSVEPGLAIRIELRWAREDANLTQAGLARAVGITQQQVAKLEAADSNPTIDTLDRIAKGLGRKLHVSLG